MTPRATYRLQCHEDFTLDDAAAAVPYLARLGISHVYTSPITTAAAGSTHGYDVIDPTSVNPELGGEAALRRLVAALRAHDMGLIIDIVPNHMGVAGGGNAWWNDVLACGQASDFARYFDIDWREKLLLPILGAPLGEVLASGDIAVDRDGDLPMLVIYGEHRLPIRPEDRGGPFDDLPALVERQHYRLGWWRIANDELNWRRFFSINDLAGLRVEDSAVFEATHALYFRLYAEGLIDGVRVDHVDGLTDPAGYCRTLRARLDAIERPGDVPPGPAYLVIEKILGAGEPLAQDWGVDGTSGYDFMEQVSALLHDPAGEAVLTQAWHEHSGRALDFEEEELVARQQLPRWQFEGQLAACVEAFAALAATNNETHALTRSMLGRAIERMLRVFPVYRTYGTGDDAPASDAAIRETVRQRAARFTPPGEADVVDRILAWLGGEGSGDADLAADAVRRFQQLSAPVAAKSVEDTAFYRYGRLLSRTDVGSDAARFALSIDEFHAIAEARARDWPHAMLTTATHDHKRGEDVRARLAVLSALPEAWLDRVAAWEAMAGEAAKDVDPADRYILYQTLYGAWPTGLDASDREGLVAFADRVIARQEKAVREAKLRSSWAQPDEKYEAQCAALVRAMLDPDNGGAFIADITAFVADTAGAARANTLAQVALRYTVPGMPDCYQGCEFADLSLVDPDNRRPVDYAAREQALDGGAADAITGAKIRLIADLLARRRAEPALFADGGYERIAVTGPRAANVLAFRRALAEQRLTCVVALHCAAALPNGQVSPSHDWWGDTALDDGRRVADLLASGPVYIG